MTENPDVLAGASHVPPQPMPQEPREVFPVKFDKDYLDFRGQPEDAELVPKASSAPESVVTQTSPTGLEDVSEEDLVISALNNVGRGTKSQPESGS